MMAQRKQAIDAAIIEREELKKEAAEVRRKAREIKKREPVSAAAQAAAAKTQPKGPQRSLAAAATPAAVQATTATPPRGGVTGSANANTLVSEKGETVHIKGREEAVRLMDMMMADEDFMRYQEELFQDMEDSMADQIESGGRLRSQSFMGKQGMRSTTEDENTGELDDTSVSMRAERLSTLSIKE